ncbi:class I SAM-dependent methyltransferase [Anaerovorax odorimutans]|uniref:class I SAM-dependent methyltransferase n=1 Tax=Anaerovorax odorimutans TaxID=109327 RepID=UPI0004171EB0|nr:class I SAM-dependent methyltransferase [Anaerovorax odorimutans]
MRLFDENKKYWTNRTIGYSKVNEEELNSIQKEKWLNVLTESFPKNRNDLKILDIGTGPGFFAILLAESGYDVTAVDCTHSMLERAKVNSGKYRDNIHWLLSDAQKLEIKDETFDVIVSRNLTWNLENPEKAYCEWIRVLKKDGVLLNFDANWYNHLFDGNMKREYENDRKRVKEMRFDDHYTCTDIDSMEKIAKKLPLSQCIRPQWDVSILENLNVTKIKLNLHVWKRVWSNEEKINYNSTPMFSIFVQK